MFVTLGEIGLGKLNEEEKLSFLDFLNDQLINGAHVKPIRNNEIIRKGMDWNAVSRSADVIQIVGFTYIVGKAVPKTLRSFFEYARLWAGKNKKDYNTEEIEAFIDFMEKDHK